MNKQTLSGTSLCTVLFIVFLVLKLTDVIDWSWWYVTMPLWIGFAIVGCVFVAVFLVAAVSEIIKSMKGK